MNRKILTFCLLLALLASIFPIVKVFADDNAMSDQQIVQIRGNCTSAKNTLNQLHTSDALLRVNMGQMYESMLTKLMGRFNGRAENGGYGVADLADISSKYETALNTFRSDYIKYEEQLSLSISIDCSKQPVAFYDAVSLARTERRKVYDDVLKLNSYVDQYQSAINQFETTYGFVRKGATGK